jgi:hypothetical protein
MCKYCRCQIEAERRRSNLDLYANNRKELKRRIYSYSGNACIGCGVRVTPDTEAAFHFHHIDSDQKEATIADLVAQSVVDIDAHWEKRVLPELKKTVLLCAFCHSRAHFYSTLGGAQLTN